MTHELVHQAAVPVIVLVVQACKLAVKGRRAGEDTGEFSPAERERLRVTLPLAAVACGLVAAGVMHWAEGAERVFVEGVQLGAEAMGVFSGGKALSGR